jgi:hypothetical protein
VPIQQGCPVGPERPNFLTAFMYTSRHLDKHPLS